MARIFLSPLIVDVRGSQKDTVFSKWKGVNYIRSRVVPANPNSTAQQEVREALADLVGLWQDADVYLAYNRNYVATGSNKSGYNTFVGDNVATERAGNLITVTKKTDESPPETLTASTGSSGGEVDVAFTPTPVGAGKKLVTYTRKVGENEWADIRYWGAAVNSPITIDGLESGESYQVYGFKIEDSTTDGNEISEDLSDTATSGS